MRGNAILIDLSPRSNLIVIGSTNHTLTVVLVGFDIPHHSSTILYGSSDLIVLPGHRIVGERKLLNIGHFCIRLDAS